MGFVGAQVKRNTFGGARGLAGGIVDLTPEALYAEWRRAWADGDRMKDGTWAPRLFAAVYRTLNADDRERFKTVTATWLEDADASGWYVARVLRHLVDSQDRLRQDRESRGAAASALPYSDPAVAVPALADSPWETSQFEALIDRLSSADDCAGK